MGSYLHSSQLPLVNQESSSQRMSSRVNRLRSMDNHLPSSLPRPMVSLLSSRHLLMQVKPLPLLNHQAMASHWFRQLLLDNSPWLSTRLAMLQPRPNSPPTMASLLTNSLRPTASLHLISHLFMASLLRSLSGSIKPPADTFHSHLFRWHNHPSSLLLLVAHPEPHRCHQYRRCQLQVSGNVFAEHVVDSFPRYSIISS